MKSISIIIPTLNEEAFLKKTIQHCLAVASDPDLLEIIIVDAGSSDNTLESVRDLNVKCFSHPKFKFKKYKSLNFGIKQAQHDLLVFLDADTLLPDHFDRLINDTISNDVVGGAFELSFDKADWKLKILQLINRIRYRFGKMYYGDQAVFCRRSVAIEVAGYPPVELMESASFCRQLKKKGKLTLIKKPVLTSSRRFHEHGFYRVLLFDIRMWIRFTFNFSVDRFGKKYWRFNLGSNG